MQVQLPDGKRITISEGSTVLDVAKAIGSRLAKAAVAARLDDRVVSLTHPIESEATVQILTGKDAEGLSTIRHTASHVMAQAIGRLWPGADIKFGIGPAYPNGFYYDFQLNHTFREEDFPAIEEEMQKIIAEDIPIERHTMQREEALAWARKRKDPYKEELINAIPEGEEISFYRQGDFTDLCAGPHLLSTGRLKHFRLQNVAGAYWRGDEKNPMMQRIYGTAFDSSEELADYFYRLEEAQKRDHRRLGRELDLFSLQEAGQGFPFFHPKGTALMNVLIDFWRKEHKKAGYEEISTPLILSAELWHQSGHYDHYRDNMYFVKIDDDDYAVKPMNCPGGILVFKRRPYSYRELPVRMAELGTVHRHELSGALHGLMRVRKFTQDDAHIYTTPEQIKEEIIGVLELTQRIYDVFGFKHHLELSTRPENSMGSDEVWEKATDALKEALDTIGLEYVINEGDGAFYGPKIDSHLEDVLGRTWQCGTIQLDFLMPERFDLSYDGADGGKHRPVMIHRTVLGSIERFIGILIEHFAGAFPLWIAPVQARILTLTDRSMDAATALVAQMNDLGFRCEGDMRNEKIGYKIRQAQLERIPYMLILGDREAENGTVSVRKRGIGDMGTFSVDDFMVAMKQEVEGKCIF